MILVLAVAGWLVLPGPSMPPPQTPLDRIVSRVNSRIVTEGDIRQARMLKLVADTSSDEVVRQALENRILVLDEIARLTTPTPAPDRELLERRRAWAAALGDAAAAGLASSGLGEDGLEAWLRDDVRIDSYLTRQFGSYPESDRARAYADWVARLRQRAGLR